MLNANRSFLFFDVDDFKSASIGGEWLVPLGEFFEAGAGIGFSRRTVPTVYTDFTDLDGTEIEQELRLRMVPIVVHRPRAAARAVQPVPAVLRRWAGVINWRYSESGDFIDFNNNREIFRASFVASGTATGPVVLGGIRFGGETLTARRRNPLSLAPKRESEQRFRRQQDRSRRLDLQLHAGIRFGRLIRH